MASRARIVLQGFAISALVLLDCSVVPAFAQSECQAPDKYKPTAWTMEVPTEAAVQALNRDSVSSSSERTKTQQVTAASLDGTSRLVVGTADFLAKRAEDEVRVWIKDELLNRLCGERSNERSRDYFPSLCGLNESYGFGMLPPNQAIAEALRRDTRALPACLVFKENNKNVFGYILMDLAQQLRAGTNPLLLYAALAETPEIRNTCVAGSEQTCPLYIGSVGIQAYLGAFSENKAENLLVSATLNRFVAKLRKDGKADLLKNIQPWASLLAACSKDPDKCSGGQLGRKADAARQLASVIEKVKSEWKGFGQQLEAAKDRKEKKEIFLDFVSTAIDRLDESVELGQAFLQEGTDAGTKTPNELAAVRSTLKMLKF